MIKKAKGNTQNLRPPPDLLLVEIADYVHREQTFSDLALKTAYQALLDSLGCAFLALQEPTCQRLLGPIVPGTVVPLGARVPGTDFVLDPTEAAFNISTCIRWLDYNDTWLAEEWGHPSDNVGGILAVADFMSRLAIQQGKKPFTVYDILHAMIMAYEIQGGLALKNSFNRVGLDHVLLVKCATAAVVSKLFGLTHNQTIDALSEVWVDGASLRTYRHAPNTGARKSWAAGDATRRGVWLAWITKQGEPGYPSALTAKHWGFSDVLFKGKPIQLARPLGCYVMENILFKVAIPAEFHAQTAVECAIELHKKAKNRWDDIEKIEVFTQDSAMRIINKEGPLYNTADRDHCLQYTIAIGLLFGELKPHHYSDEVANDPRIDILRSKMNVKEDLKFSRDYLDPEKRSIANAVQLFFKGGGKSDKITQHYPLGHKRRRQEAESALKEKYCHAISVHLRQTHPSDQGYQRNENKQGNHRNDQNPKNNKIEHLQGFWGNFDLEKAKRWSIVEFINDFSLP